MNYNLTYSPSLHRKGLSSISEEALQTHSSHRNISNILKHFKLRYFNRVYLGIGFYNDNGGLEFFSPSYKERNDDALSAYLDELNKKQSELEDDLITLKIDLEDEQFFDEKLHERYHKYEAYLKEVQNKINELIQLGKSHNLPHGGKARQQRLSKERRTILSNIEKIKSRLNGHRQIKKNIERIDYLLCELREKMGTIRNKLDTSSFYTIGQSGIKTIHYNKDELCGRCCLFVDMFDFIGFDFLIKNHYIDPELQKSDVKILNNPRNFLTFLMDIDIYEQVYCFFPKTLAGYLLLQAIKARKGGKIEIFDRHDSYVNLYDYAKTFPNFQTQNPINYDEL